MFMHLWGISFRGWVEPNATSKYFALPPSHIKENVNTDGTGVFGYNTFYCYSEVPGKNYCDYIPIRNPQVDGDCGGYIGWPLQDLG